jgi:hypothetical protein
MKINKILKLVAILPLMLFAKSLSAQWILSGNTITSSSYLGSNNNLDLVIKRDFVQSGLLDSASGNTSWGVGSLNAASPNNNNTAIGFKILPSNTSGGDNTAIGNMALFSNTGGNWNSVNGMQALYTNASGNSNVANGYQSLYYNSSGTGNVANGFKALDSNTIGVQNTANGYGALYSNKSGSYNVGDGYSSLYSNSTGTYNSALGVGANVSAGNLNYATAIGAGSLVGQSNCLVLGGTGTYAVNVGVGTSTPNSSALLDLTSTTQGLLPPRIALTATNSPSPLAANVAGMILYNTATAGTSPYNVTPGYYYNNGTAWVRLTDATSPGWTLTGNAGTNPTTNFMGTSDNEDVVFKRNNVQAGLINSALGNTSWGVYSLSNTSGSNNTGIGYQALVTNTTGTDNTAIGYNADVATSSVSNAISLGYNANAISNQLAISPNIQLIKATGLPTGLGYVLTDVAGNGNLSLQPSSGGGSGWSLTGNAITSGNFMGTTNDQDVVFERNNALAGLLNNSYGNTTWGVGALNYAATGFAGVWNVAEGYQAMYNNTAGASSNVAVGYQSLYNTTAAGPGSGGLNTATGFQSMLENIGGDANAAFGASALFNNTYGRYNAAVGMLALQDNTTGDFNSSLGEQSLISNRSGSYNSAIGWNADMTDTAFSDATALGSGASVNASDKVRIGSSSVTAIEGQVAYSYPSDARFKYKIQADTLGLAFIKQLNPVNYNFDTKKFDEYLMQKMPDSIKQKKMNGHDYTTSSKIVHAGFLAQDVEAVCKKNGYYFDGLHVPDANNATDHYSLAYSQFVMPLVKAVQQLSTQNDSLQSANTQQQQINAQQQQANNNLQQQLNDLKTTISQMQTAMSQCCNSYSSNMAKEAATPVVVTGADVPTLQQNTPNPYNGSTVIGYYLPQSTTNAEIIVTDLSGNVIKSISLNGTGNGQITFSAGSLAAGSYFYTLLVNGQKIDTKQMIIN